MLQQFSLFLFSFYFIAVAYLSLCCELYEKILMLIMLKCIEGPAKSSSSEECNDFDI